MSFDQALDCDGFGFQESFWGLLLPVTVHGRVSDIWRAYLTQKLLWDADWPDFSGGLVCGTGLCSLLSCMGTSSAGFPAFSSGFGKPLFAGEVCRGARFKVQSSRSEVGQVVSFVPPHVVHDRVAHDYLKDFQSEGDLQPGYPVSDRSSPLRDGMPQVLGGHNRAWMRRIGSHVVIVLYMCKAQHAKAG